MEENTKLKFTLYLASNLRNCRHLEVMSSRCNVFAESVSLDALPDTSAESSLNTKFTTSVNTPKTYTIYDLANYCVTHQCCIRFSDFEHVAHQGLLPSDTS